MQKLIGTVSKTPLLRDGLGQEPTPMGNKAHWTFVSFTRLPREQLARDKREINGCDLRLCDLVRIS